MRMALPSLVAPSQDLEVVSVASVVEAQVAPATGSPEPWVDTLAVSTTSPAAFHA